MLRRHARLVAKKWTYPPRGPGRPSKPEALRALVLRLARENDGWSIAGSMANCSTWAGRSAVSTVWEILQRAGVDPAPRRADRSWTKFLTAQDQGILAVDVFHVDRSSCCACSSCSSSSTAPGGCTSSASPAT
ncbi:hypothetical protein [Streptomyces sp. NPDC058441]|uniref:hypothetical protein n=1 Tax=Streptomyces sp. NPDC058441 TaxID=3346502 RepID=UPI0036677716